MYFFMRFLVHVHTCRYFESLQSRYWNNTMMSDCPVLDDSDGITLQSLGGVFIATLIGLVIALITLGVEVALQGGRRTNKHISNVPTRIFRSVSHFELDCTYQLEAPQFHGGGKRRAYVEARCMMLQLKKAFLPSFRYFCQSASNMSY